MKKMLAVLLLITMESNVMQAKPPISPERVKKELLKLFECGPTIDRMQRYIEYVTAERQIKYLTVQVNDFYGYLRYRDRLFTSDPEKYKKEADYEIELRNALVKRCRKDYSYMEEKGLDIFCQYSHKIAYFVIAFRE